MIIILYTLYSMETVRMEDGPTRPSTPQWTDGTVLSGHTLNGSRKAAGKQVSSLPTAVNAFVCLSSRHHHRHHIIIIIIISIFYLFFTGTDTQHYQCKNNNINIRYNTLQMCSLRINGIRLEHETIKLIIIIWRI